MAKKRKQAKQPESPVQPIETSQSAPIVPTVTADSVAQLQTQAPDSEADKAIAAAQAVADEAVKRAEEAEARAKAAEESAAQAKAETEEVKTQVTEAANGGLPPQASQSGQDKFYDKDGNELCWNCVNHGKEKVLENGVCSDCGFVKDKLYNGEVEAAKARQRAVEQQY